MDLVTSCKEKLTHFRIKELKDILTQLGLSKQGKKQDLADRILAIISDDRVSGIWAKKSVVRKEEVAKLVDDMYRKLQIPGATELASKGQGVSDVTINNNNTTFKEEVEDSYQSEKVRCPCGTSLQADSMIKCEDKKCNVWQHIACVIIPEKPMEGILPPPPPVFYCEICRLGRADPFWVTMGHPLYPVKLSIANVPTDGTNPVQSVEKTFQLTKADRDLLAKPEFELQAWCMLLNDKVSFRMQWPQYADLQINGMPVRALNRPGSQLLGANGRDDGPLIMPYTRDGSNKISLTGVDARVFCLGVRIMKRRTVQQIMNMIPKESDGERFEDAVARVCRCVGGGPAAENADSNSDLEVVADSIPVNLRCPMSGSRMKIAGRFKPCAHMGCFDLDVFVQMNQRSRKWQCPICLKNYSLENVIIDPYFTRITTKMRNCGEDVTEVEVKPDGCWRVKAEKDIKNLGELSQWHSPDGTLCIPMEAESKPKPKPKPEALKQVKQEGVSEGHTSLKLGIKKNRNGIWEVSKPENPLSLSSGNKQPENLNGIIHSGIPMSSSATGNGRNSEDPSINQSTGGGGHFGHSTTNGSLSPNYGFNFNPSFTDVIVLSDSEEETEPEPEPVYKNKNNGVSFSTPLPNPDDPSLIPGGSSCLGLFNTNEDDFGVPFWSLPSTSQVGPSFQLFGSDENQMDPMGSVPLLPESSIYQNTLDINDGLVDNPLAYGHDDPSLQLFLPTRQADVAAEQAELRDPPSVSNGLQGDDWISLSLGSGGGGGGGSSPSSSTPASGTRRQSTRSRSAISIGNSAEKDTPQEKNASSSKGKGKAVLKPSQDEGRGGPHTRNASRRRAASDKDTLMKSLDDESSSEDEDVDISPVDIDDALVIEDDEISEDDDDDHDDVLRDDSLPVYMPYVHDVKLTDSTDNTTLAGPTTSDSHTKCSSTSRSTPARGSDSTDFRGPASFSSRGSMSFAAAAMAGLASANARAVRGGSGGGRDRHNHNTPRLSFSSNGKQLNRHLTIYQAIQQQLVLDEGDNDQYNTDGSKLWNDIYTITYQKGDLNSQKTINLTKPGSTCQMSLLDSILQGELPCDMEKDNPTYNILSLLRVLEGLNQLAPCLRIETVIDQFSEGKISSINDIITPGVRVSSDEFVNSKLTPKLSRQIQDVLALCSGSLPSWCYQLTKACPFLFPFETRRQYFYSTAFGLSRALHRLQQQGADGHGSTTERELRVRRLSRQKVRVSRNRILESAAKVMEMYSSQKAVLEVEYFGEVGTGLGPTLEFYTLLSHDLQRTGLKMWRCNNSGDGSVAMEVEVEEKKDDLGDIVISPLGLFPRPWVESSCDGKVIEHFWLLGCVMAKALQDGRLLDMPLSTAFYKLVLGQELDLHDVSSFDAELGKTLQELQALVCRKKYLESTPRHDCNAILDLNFRGAPVEDLCLDFTLPGFPDYILKPGNEDVSIDNLEEYISLVVAATVKTGITRQLEAFRAGFNQVFDISALQIFTPNELDHLLCGQRELWEADKLVDHIKFDHGYTSKSPAIVNLLEIMGEFTPEQQRAFCQFVTGAPRLPPGGLAILNPKLTIVRKHSSTSSNVTSSAGGASESADDDLPSVMTCANYLKLPAYSTKEIMYKQLVYAISEGQGSFDLS